MGRILPNLWVWLKFSWSLLLGHSVIVVTANGSGQGYIAAMNGDPITFAAMTGSLAITSLHRQGYVQDWQVRNGLKEQLKEIINDA